MNRFNEELFLEKFSKIQGENFVYLGYENGLVKFLCKKHNLITCKTPSHVLQHIGCPECAKEKRKAWNDLQNKIAKETFVEKAKEIHGDKYDYSKVNYVKNNVKVTLICPIHGEFDIVPNAHLMGRGCKKCGTEHSHSLSRKTAEQFIKEAKEIHGDKYDYSKVDYVNCDTKVCIICPKHGEFWQTPNKHLSGRGCMKCGHEKTAQRQTFTTEQFIKKAKEIHGNKYDYSKVEYKGYDEDVCIICPTHGEFWQTPDSHLQGSNCRMCANNLSKNENEVYDFIVENLGKENVIKSERSILEHGSEIDVYIPSLKLGIEYNGCRWHSEQFGKDKYYHLKKTEECNKKGVSLIHIFEDEYKNKKDIVLSKIRHLIKCDNQPKIHGRKCEVCQITYQESKGFLDANHIQGSQKATIYLGAKYNNELVGVMTFVKIKDDEWELNRFATDIKYICQGVGGKLFSYFIKNYNPQIVKSFADRRWTINETNNLYTKLGFVLKETLKPDYRYVIDGYYDRIHKFNFRKGTLHKKYGFDLTMTENEMAEQLKAYKIWDCGLYKYVWQNHSF
jgi:hypothetical protein